MLRTSLAAMYLGTLVFVISCMGPSGPNEPGPLPIIGKIYYVDNGSSAAADTNPGTEAKPWKTISRAGAAKELRPGDAVFIKSGVYREAVTINVSGEPGKPITFAAAPDAKVVIKGSEIVKGPWTQLSTEKEPKDAATQRLTRIWKVKLGDEFFTDPNAAWAYKDKSKWWVTQVFWQDTHALQMIGPDPLRPNTKEYTSIRTIGTGVDDMIENSFYYDPKDQTLYVYIDGVPEWYVMEVGVRSGALGGEKIHDVVIRGLEVRHNRTASQQGCIAGFGASQRVLIENCRVQFGDFGGLGLFVTKDCVVRNCDVSNNGAIGLVLYKTEDTVAEDCTMMYNNYRKLSDSWGVSAGSKNIPDNKRTTMRRCELAYNDGRGVWFDTTNSDIRILDNIVHHNTDAGIYFEVNGKGGGVIAGNLVYANGGRGIYIAASANTYVVNNTLVDNDCGIVAHTRGGKGAIDNTCIMNNLLLYNYVAGADAARGCDLTLEIPAPDEIAAANRHSDYNVFADNSWTPTMRPNWNDNYPLAAWQKQFGQDLHSRLMRVGYRRFSTGFELLTRQGLDSGGALPKAVTDVWKPAKPKQVGATRMQWPPIAADIYPYTNLPHIDAGTRITLMQPRITLMQVPASH